MGLADYYCQNKDFEKCLGLYREVLPKLSGSELNNVINKYITYALQYAQNMSSEKKWADAVEIYRDIMKYSGFPINVYKNIGLCMKAMGNADLAIKFL